MKTLFILNDPPYGTERSFNGVRLANALARIDGHEVRIFLMGDAALVANRGQKVPTGYYNLELMLGTVIKRGAQVAVCGTCLDARGLSEEQLIDGSHRSTMDELADWSTWADKVLVF